MLCPSDLLRVCDVLHPSSHSLSAPVSKRESPVVRFYSQRRCSQISRLSSEVGLTGSWRLVAGERRRTVRCHSQTRIARRGAQYSDGRCRGVMLFAVEARRGEASTVSASS